MYAPPHDNSQRAFTPTLYTDPRPSQPLSPNIDTMVPPTPMPTPTTPSLPASPLPEESGRFGTSSTPGFPGISDIYTPDEVLDDKTIVVSTSKFAHRQQQSQPLAVVQSNEDNAVVQHDERSDETAKVARINLNAIPTPTPLEEEVDPTRSWFSDQLTQPAIPASALEPEATENNLNEAELATPSFSSFDNEVSQDSTPPQVDIVDEVYTESSAIAPPMEQEDETGPQSSLPLYSDATDEEAVLWRPFL